MRSKLIRIAKILQVFTEYTRDGWLFLRYNGFSPLEPRDRRLSHKTIIEAHTIEKGLALPEPRPYFGQNKVRALLEMNAGWVPPPGDISRTMLLGALRDYRAAFVDTSPPDAALAAQVDTFLDTQETETAEGGVRGYIEKKSECDASAVAFLNARFSARDFAPRTLEDREIATVVHLAQRAPSQCNRQSTRLHVYRDRARIARLLELQGGGRGFIQAVPTLFVITSEITAWGGPQQRNQPYVDGGIFTTMLLLSLDAHGFVSCPMNLAITHSKEQAIKREGTIPKRERLVVMVAAGLPPTYPFRAARSPRWPTDAICTIHDHE
ncbi:nitroreductase family protein [Falsihalocynthiibacter sp. BN13B15]|uniref:nitroreductase family protein n=1 Tax=Falsihalocynthiibacter sp. BN13B15 TaxID=3240871 RepID=UPI00350E9987